MTRHHWLALLAVGLLLLTPASPGSLTSVPASDVSQGAPLDASSLIGTWYAAPCGDSSYTFAVDGTYQAQGVNVYDFDHSGTYRWLDAHKVEIDGLQYEAGRYDGTLGLFLWPRPVDLQRTHTPCPPTPDSPGLPTDTAVWQATTPLPPAVPSSAPAPVSTAVSP